MLIAAGSGTLAKLKSIPSSEPAPPAMKAVFQARKSVKSTVPLPFRSPSV